MDRSRSPIVAALAVAFAALPGCGQAGVTGTDEVAAADAAFTEMQARGQRAMGVDQYTSTHLFDALPDGGRIELQRDGDDPAGVAGIRHHLQQIAEAFDAGEFSTPAFVHMQSVPGASVMAEKRDGIAYTYRELPRGGEVRMVTQDPEALQAIHEFMAFQRQEHRAGGMEHGGDRDMGHGGDGHGGVSGRYDHAPDHPHQGPRDHSGLEE